MFPTFLKQMQSASVLPDGTAQLMARLTCYLSSDALELSPVGAEATHCSVLEVEPSATKITPIAQIQKHFSHQKFSSARLSLE